MSKTMIMYTVEKKEILGMRYGRIRELIESLGKENRASLAMFYDGYNDVVEEIYEIPEIRKWARGLLEKFPYISYFLEDDLSESLRMFILLISKVEMTAYQGEIKRPIIEYSLDEIATLPRTFASLRISDKLIRKISYKTLQHSEKIGDVEGGIATVNKITSFF